MRTDIFLVRWIRDQNMDYEKARRKLVKVWHPDSKKLFALFSKIQIQSLEWRKQNKVDEVLGEDFSEIVKNCPFDLDGQDMKGRPSKIIYFT